MSAAMKARTPEAGADVKEDGLFSGASNLEDGLMSQSPSPRKMGDSCLKAHLYLSVETEVFLRRGRGTEQRDKGKGLKISLRADEHSLFR